MSDRGDNFFDNLISSDVSKCLDAIQTLIDMDEDDLGSKTAGELTALFHVLIRVSAFRCDRVEWPILFVMLWQSLFVVF